MKNCLLLLLITATINAFGQNGKEPIPIVKTYEIPPVGEQLLIELKSAQLDVPYSRNEVIEIYNSDDLPLGTDIMSICAFDNCVTDSQKGIEFNPNVPAGVINGRENGSKTNTPLGLTLNQPIDPGKYLIVVRNKDNKKVIHRRLLTLVNPIPIITNVEVEYPDGSIMSDKILINQNQDLRGVKLKFDGQNLENEFKSVSVQGLELKKIEGEVNTYETVNWTAQKLKDISLEDPKIIIERHHVSNAYKFGIEIEAQPPIITGNLVRKIGAGQNIYSLKLNVTNLFPRAQLKLAETDNKNILTNEGVFDGAKVDIGTGTITQEVLFNDGILNRGNATFLVQVINRDGQSSEEKMVQMQVQEAAVTATPVVKNKPFVEGVNTQVKFIRSDNASAFRFNGEVTLRINGSQQVIVPKSLDGALNQFSAKVLIPNGMNGSVPFELINNRNSWRGYFDEVASRPEVIEEPREVYSGSAVLLHIKEPSDKVKATILSDEEGVKLNDNDFTDGVIEIATSKNVPVNTTFSVVLYYEGHELEVLDFLVKNWPSPAKVTEFGVGRKRYAISKDDMIVLSDNDVLVLQSKKGQQKKTTSKLTAQLIKADGTKLGVPQSLVYNEKTQTARTVLTPYGYGLKGGDEFMVELVNPLSQPVIQRGYVKRSFRERLLANAGVSAVNVFLSKREDENGEELPGASLISGVTLGVYYMMENMQGSGKRPFGYGVNIMAQEEEQDVDLRLGASVLFYETLSMGLSFGSGGAAFFIGANVSFLDVSKIFTNN